MYLWKWTRYFNILFVVTNIQNQGLKQKKKNKDFILDLNKKTNFQKHKQNATKILYPLYIIVVYGQSESRFLIHPFCTLCTLRCTFQIVAYQYQYIGNFRTF